MQYLSHQRKEYKVLLTVMEKLTGEKTGLTLPIDPDALSLRQMDKIKAAAARASETNPFYKDRFANCDISGITSPFDMANIPFTEQSEISCGADNFLCVPAKMLSRITSLNTSGSTAQPKRIFFTDSDLANMVNFFSERIVPVVGDGKRLIIMMSNSTYGSIADLLKKGAEKSGISAEIIGHVTDLARFAPLIRNGDSIVGLPSDIFALSKTYPALRPSSVLLSADYAAESLIDSIRESWQCRVYTHYGLTEVCFGCAVQCADGSAHHIRHEDLFFEIIDPKTKEILPYGMEGEIVITTFGHEAMPLFRYRTGDISSLEAGECQHCGSRMPRLGKVRGRVQNRIPLGDSYISIEKTDEILYSSCGLISCKPQLEVSERGAVMRLTVQADASFDSDSTVRKIKDAFPELADVKIENTPHYNVLTGKRRL